MTSSAVLLPWPIQPCIYFPKYDIDHNADYFRIILVATEPGHSKVVTSVKRAKCIDYAMLARRLNFRRPVARRSNFYLFQFSVTFNDGVSL